ncbi:MAG: hypothetical protein IIA72_21635 [Proteobacteria bacterium]|nr:hypothetical protein [Pseudomonadota bacterium]
MARYITTVETPKHRFFQFLDAGILPDNMLVNIEVEDAFFLGILSSRIHVVWALAAGGTLEDRPRYNKTRCFDPFPFPDPNDELKEEIRDLAERLDTHRKAVLEKRNHLTMTALYNVLEMIRTEKELTDAEKDIYDAGFIGILRQIHDDLDKAVTKAYGWSKDLSNDEILERLVALNHVREEEERNGKIRWLRPDFQAPKETPAAKLAEQLEAELIVTEVKAKKPRLPAALPDQVAAVRAMLAGSDDAVAATDLARCFAQGRRVEKRVEEVLRTLTLLGQAEHIDGRYILSD